MKIAVLICYDRHFPEAARVLGLKGAHLVVVPTATYRDWIREVWEVELRAHAIANMFYVGGVNKVKRHTRPSQKSPGGIIEKEAPIHISNVALVDPKENKASRVGFTFLEDGRKVRFARRSGEIVDR